jgi:hypothetical protein
LSQSLKRHFPTASRQSDLLALASQPLLAPAYLNFVDRIDIVSSTGGALVWREFDVHVRYRSLLKTTGRVAHRVIDGASIVQLRHDGVLVSFEAQFSIFEGHVELDCVYTPKVAMMNWLVAVALDRTLVQIAGAMDRFAFQGR